MTIFEQRKKLGGMLRYGIPNYRLPREELDREINHLLSLGIHVKTEVTVGEDPNIADLREEYDAVYIAIGAHIDRKIGIEGKKPKASSLLWNFSGKSETTRCRISQERKSSL